jgi:mannose-6-phosphate isomerase
MLYPLFFHPIHKERIWGGRKLAEKYGRVLPSNKIGESWEITCHDHGMGMIRNGKLKGLSLQEAIEKYGEELLGSAIYNDRYRKFPLLIKLLDAADVLSVQVHPDDEYANAYENGELGKTEMWYIIDAKPGSKLVYGIKHGVSKEDFKRSLEQGQLEECLRELEVKPGDVLYIPAGLVHAIGAGILICEIQQNSDTTYRVYDWNRMDDKGNPRELHIEKALDVIDFEGRHSTDGLNGLRLQVEGGQRIIYVACEYFAMEKLIVDGDMELKLDGKRFQALTCLEGTCKIEYKGRSADLLPGQSCLIPASLPSINLNGSCTVIRAYVPDKESNIIHPLLQLGYTMDDLSVIAGLF